MNDVVETIAIMFCAFMLFGTPVMIVAIKEWGKRQQRTPVSDAKLAEMQAQLQSQRELTRQFQQRLENLEHVIAGNEYQAAQRVSRAMDDSRAVAEVRTQNRESPSVARSVVG